MRMERTGTAFLKRATLGTMLLMVLLLLGLAGCEEDTAVNAHFHTSTLDITTSTDNHDTTVTQYVSAVSAPDGQTAQSGLVH